MMQANPKAFMHGPSRRPSNILDVGQDCTGIGRCYQGCVAAQPPTFVTHFGRLNRTEALLYLLRSQIDLETTLDQVYVYQIPIDQGCDRPTCCSLRGDVTDAGSARTAGETSIGYQGNFVAKAHTHNIGGWRQHFLHTWSTTRTFVANDDDITLLYLSVQDTCTGLLLRIVDTS